MLYLECGFTLRVFIGSEAILSVCVSRATLLAAVEGESSLMVFGIFQQKLHLKGRRALQHLSLPTSLTIDSEGSLWVAEGCSGKVSFAGGILASSSFNNALEVSNCEQTFFQRNTYCVV